MAATAGGLCAAPLVPPLLLGQPRVVLREARLHPRHRLLALTHGPSHLLRSLLGRPVLGGLLPSGRLRPRHRCVARLELRLELGDDLEVKEARGAPRGAAAAPAAQSVRQGDRDELAREQRHEA